MRKRDFLIERVVVWSLLAAVFCVADRASALAGGSRERPKPESTEKDSSIGVDR